MVRLDDEGIRISTSAIPQICFECMQCHDGSIEALKVKIRKKIPLYDNRGRAITFSSLCNDDKWYLNDMIDEVLTAIFDYR